MRQAILSSVLFLAFGTALLAEKHALLIGIGVYNPESSIPTLDGPGHDLDSLSELLTGPLGFRKDNVTILRDQSATFDRILSELDTLKKRVKPGDYVVFYYSGHGTSYGDPAAKTWGLDPNTGALLPYDIRIGTPEQVRAKLIIGKTHLRPVFTALDSIATVFAIFDTCYSADAAKSIRVQRTRYVSPSLLMRGATRGLRSANDLDADLATMAAQHDTEPFPYKQLISLAAAGMFQPACDISADDVRRRPDLTFDHQPHGVLTEALLRGMKGEADRNRDGTISHDELYSYLLEASVNWSHKPVLQASADAAPLLAGAAFQAKGAAPKAESKDSEKTDVCVRADRLAPELMARIRKLSGIRVADTCPDGLIARASGSGGFDLFQASGIAINARPFAEDQLLARIAAEPDVQILLNLGSQKTFNVDLRMEPDDRSVYNDGCKIAFKARTAAPAYLLLLNIDTQGAVTVVYPFKTQFTQAEANEYEAIGAGGRVGAPFGIEFMKLFAFREKPVGIDAWNTQGDDPITVEPGTAKFRDLMQMVRSGKASAEARLRLVTAPGKCN